MQRQRLRTYCGTAKLALPSIVRHAMYMSNGKNKMTPLYIRRSKYCPDAVSAHTPAFNYAPESELTLASMNNLSCVCRA